MEKLLVAQALDQRDLLKKKIEDAIRKMQTVVVCKEKDTKIKGTSIEDVEKDIKADWQSVNDMIDRYNRINRAIVLSNAQTTIEFSDGTVMTKAEAISLKKRNENFLDQLLYKAENDYRQAVQIDARIDSEKEKARETYLSSVLTGTDKKAPDEATLKIIEQTVAPFSSKWIDPIDVKAKIKELTDKQNQFKSEVETLIKISNATTLIEF